MSDSADTMVRVVLPLVFEDEYVAAKTLAAAVAAAAAMQGGWDCVILGAEADASLADLALSAGAAAVWYCHHPDWPQGASAEQAASVCLEALDHCGVATPTLHLLPCGDAGEELAARMALLRGAVALGRLQAVEQNADGSLCALREAFGSRATARLRIHGEAWACMRPPAPLATTALRAQRHDIALCGPLPVDLPMQAEPLPQAGRRLEGARVVVSGGRGMGGSAGFEKLQALADALGGALGASLAAVDEGWAPVSRQVGLSGKFVAPEWYLAVGISGAPHHLAGLGDGTRIVAINSDAEADIFRVATIGCVADWRELVPLLLQELGASATV